jgi:isopentenyl-diphosphate delta-isomerase
MDDPQGLGNRKSEHIRINLEEDVLSSITTGLEKLHFVNQALPEFDLAEVDTSITLFGKKLSAPLLISSMTGGTQEAERINLHLAQTAQEKSIALGLGSQRAAIEDPAAIKTFQVRRVAPDILLFANLGAVQLNYGYGIDQCRRAVEMVEADGLFLHLNALQEALQPEGNTRFRKLLNKIEEVCKKLSVPVIVKEVGWGISGQTARQLVNAGVAAIDVAGAGGTSWSQVEMHRLKDPRRAAIAAAFRDWGIPTATAIRQVHQIVPQTPIIGSGGLRSGVEAAKVIALGATLAGIAGPFLKAASRSHEASSALADDVLSEMRICMFACGASSLPKLQETQLVEF